MEFDQMPLSMQYAYLASVFRPPGHPGAYIDTSPDDELARAYWQLFQGPGRPIVQPYESVHLEGRLMGLVTDQVRQCYSDAGLILHASENEIPDHLSVELAYMAYLASQEESQTTGSVIWRARQRRFLNEHLDRWVCIFCDQVQASQVHPFFTVAATSLQQLISEELNRLEHPAGVNRYPNIRVELLTKVCTLCTLCVDNCDQQALTVRCYPATISILFNRRKCNGCRACLRLCPEKAIRVHKGHPRSEPVEEAYSILMEARRVICPNCLHPHIAEPWLDRLVEQLKADGSMRKFLELCPLCKAKMQEGDPFQMSVAMELHPYG